MRNFANAMATRDILLRLTLQSYLPLKYLQMLILSEASNRYFAKEIRLIMI